MNPRTAEQITLISKLLELYRQLLEKLMEPQHNKLDAWCEATKEYEGYFPGSRSFRNNNVGNLKFIGQRAAIGKDTQGFAIFKTYEDGYNTLYTMLKRAATGLSKVYRPDMSLIDFYATYAPDEDDNDSRAYAHFVAKKLGVLPSTKIRDLA